MLQNAEFNTNEKNGIADTMIIAVLIVLISLLQELPVTLLSLQNNVEL